MKNVVYEKQIINGEEVMIIIEETEVEDIVVEQPSFEEIQQQINNLTNQIVVLQSTLDAIVDPSPYIEGN